MDVSSLDMLQFHWWDYSNRGYLDALKHLNDLKEEGKIKTVALTNFDTERLQIILENGIPVVSNQVQHSLVDMRPQQKMAELCQLTGVKLITYGTVMGGLLSEKFLDTNLSIPFSAPPLNTPSLQKYKRACRSMIIEPFCQDELALYRHCAERRDKELRPRLIRQCVQLIGVVNAFR
ncbi:hypothetical protein NC653_022256 [Populus alba x Populus x berolinensis]|uniref:NADP-dependent oxidoreductase domain-containing protein n=1 Tax=Populus alba x Populus x berolinensis TaxID=444605 RepID=A0AAD6MEJ8_9ROSI|nr:hypothetical protein NC653_022256 [Populus alba x Populus x berolinensis]